MKIKFKLLLKSPVWLWRYYRIARLGSKHVKDRKKYEPQFRNDFLVKKAEKTFKEFKINLKVFGYSNIPKKGPVLLVSNHADNADSFAILLALRKETFDKKDFNKIPTFLGKKELEAKMLSRSISNIQDTFFIDRENPRQALKVINEMILYVRDKKTYPVIFPAGTRSKDETIGEFIPTSFKIAKKGHFSIIPVTINNSVNAFNVNRSKPIEIEVHFHKIIKASEIIHLTNEAISSRIYNIINNSFKKPNLDDKIKTKFKQDEVKNLKYKEIVAKRDARILKKELKNKNREDKILQKIIKQDKEKAEKEKQKQREFKEKEEKKKNAK